MDYTGLDNPALWALAVGFFSPPIISVIQQRTWSTRTKSLVAFSFYIVVAAATAGINGLLTVGDIVRVILLVFLSAATSYQSLWKPTGISPAIEDATSPASKGPDHA